jgi:hypothetical protein
MNLEERMARDEKKRLVAFENRDAINYVYMCNKLGVNAEDRDLYEAGVMEIAMKEKNDREVWELNSTKSYQEFLRMYRGLGLDKNLNRGYVSKRRLLETNFPRRFGKHGSQPLDNYTPAKVGTLFNQMVNYSKERVGK